MKNLICAIVPAHNVEQSITNTLRQLNRAKIDGAVVVCNGCLDATLDKIRRVQAALCMKVDVLTINLPLGHDVPRAFGAAYARQLRRLYSDFVFIDSDWNGSFGPMLESFVKDYQQERRDIMWTARPQRIEQPSHYTAPWQEAERIIPPFIADADPNVVPFIVSKQTFHYVSPYWLHHPGKWFAYAIRIGRDKLNMGINSHWDRKLTGHITQNAKHYDMMKETLLGDAAEGACILANKPLSRTWQGKTRIGYHPARRTDILQNWLGTIQLQKQDP